MPCAGVSGTDGAVSTPDGAMSTADGGVSRSPGSVFAGHGGKFWQCLANVENHERGGKRLRQRHSEGCGVPRAFRPVEGQQETTRLDHLASHDQDGTGSMV